MLILYLANEEFYYRHMQVIKSLIASLQNYDTDNTGLNTYKFAC